MSIDRLAQALGDAARRHGARVTIATSAADALSPEPGHALVALSLASDGATAHMTRGPVPQEGGALHVHQIDVIPEGDGLRPATLDWIEGWAMDMASIERHGLAMAAAGLAAEATPPWGVRIDAAAHCVLASAGHDAGEMVARAAWRRSDSGFSSRITLPGLEAEVDRYLDLVRFRLMRLEREAGDVQYEETGEAVHMTVDTREALPETLITAAEGRPLSCLVATDAVDPPPNTIRSAHHGGGTLTIVADLAHRRIAIPTKEKTA